MEAIHLKRIDQGRLVELPPVVFAAAREGDGVAIGLLEHQADEVVSMAVAAIRRLRMTALDVDVVLGGGLFRSGDERLLRGVERGVLAVAPRASVAALSAPPVIGAAMLGLDRLGLTGSRVRARVRDALREDRIIGGLTKEA